MKLTVLLAAYNEVLFIDYVIKSILPFVDEIIITDAAMKAAIDAGYGIRSTDGTSEILKKYIDNKKVFLAPLHDNPPHTHKDLMQPAFNMAKQRNADWVFHVCGDEVWPEKSLKPMKKILESCDKRGIMALNVWMHMFAPDFWHIKDFRNPRLAKMTPDAELISGDAVYWPQRGLYQYAGDLNSFSPPNTPEAVKKINSDYPSFLRAYHYSCVGKQRVEFKVDFFKKFNNTYGDAYNEAYIKEDWESFIKEGFKVFKGKHPDIMCSHELYREKLY